MFKSPALGYAFARITRITQALTAAPPEGGGVPARLAELLQWTAALSVALPVLVATLGAFAEPFSHLFEPAGLQLLVQLPGALAVAVAAHYLRLGIPHERLARWLRWFVAFWFAFFGGWLLALGLEVLLNAL